VKSENIKTSDWSLIRLGKDRISRGKIVYNGYVPNTPETKPRNLFELFYLGRGKTKEERLKG
jgi:hypothetical protein